MKLVHGTSGNKAHREIKSQSEFAQFSTRYEPETSSIWCWMQPEPRPSLNTTLIDELFQLQQQLTTTYNKQETGTVWPFRHLILASKIPGIYNLGGDLELFKQYITHGEGEKLRAYAYKSIDLVIRNIKISICRLPRFHWCRVRRSAEALKLPFHAMQSLQSEAHSWAFLKYSSICSPAWEHITCSHAGLAQHLRNVLS